MRRDLTIRESGVQFLVALVAMAVLQSVLGIVTPSTITIGGVAISTWVVLSINQIAFLLAVYVFFRWRRVSIVDTARMKTRLKGKQVLIIFFISVFSICAFLPLAQIFLNILSALGFSITSGFPVAENFGVFLLEVIVIAAVPAFSEELLMRGAIISGLKARNYLFAIFFSALLFSLMHGSALQTVHQFGLGIMLACVFLITGSFWAPVLLHFFNNFISIFISNYVPAIDNIDLGNWNYLLWAFIVPISMFVLLVLLKALVRTKEAETPRFSIVDEDEFMSVFNNSTGENSGRDYAVKPRGGNGAKAFFSDVKGLIADTWRDVAGCFARGGFRRRAMEINSLLARLDDDPEALQGYRVPAQVWLALVCCVVMWVVNLVVGFL